MQTIGDGSDGYASADFAFHADGTNDVVIHFLNGDIPSDEETEAWLCGYSIVPEPGIGVLLLAGAVLLAVCRLGRKPRN